MTDVNAGALDLGQLRRLPPLGPSPLTFTLTWASRVGGPPADLDLGCLYVTDDHRRGALQTVGVAGAGQPGGRTLTDDRGQPIAELGRDDRADTSSATGEVLTVHQPRRLRFLLVSVSIYGGSDDFTDVAAELTARSDQREVAMSRLASPPPNLRWCAAMVGGLHRGATHLLVEERYFHSAFHADRHYGFGLRWRVGVKDAPRSPGATPDRSIPNSSAR